MEHGEAVVMLGGDHHVLLSGGFSGANPALGIEIDWVKLLRKLFIFRYGNFRAVHDPLADARNLAAFPFARRDRVEPPVNEHPEARIAKPRHSVLVRFSSTRRANRSN